MKNTAIAFLLLFGLSLSGYGQLGSLKGKAKNLKKNVEKTTKKTVPGTSGSSVSENAKEIQTAQRMEGEAEGFIAELEAIYGDVAKLDGTNDEALEKALYNLKSKLSTLTNYYSEYSTKLPEIQAKYDEFKVKEDAEMKIREDMSEVRYQLKSDAEWASKMKADFNYSKMLDGYGPTYARFDGNVQTYKGTGKDYADINGYIATLEEHYNTTFPSYADEFTNYLKTERLKRSYSEDDWKETPKSCIKSINYQLDKFEDLYSRTNDASWVDAIKKELETRKGELQEYIDSGAFDKYLAEEYQKKVDARRMEKPGRTDASLIALVKKKHNVGEYGTIKRVIIRDSDWSVEKNGLGIPLEKYIRVQVCTVKDGVCDLRYGRLFKTYEGGGSYGNTKLSHYGSPLEINCANVNK